MKTLCQPGRIQQLTSGSLGSSGAMCWRASLLSATDRITKEFPSFPDLVQPFTAALSMVGGRACGEGVGSVWVCG